jgi:hypothetical protein
MFALQFQIHAVGVVGEVGGEMWRMPSPMLRPAAVMIEYPAPPDSNSRISILPSATLTISNTYLSFDMAPSITNERELKSPFNREREMSPTTPLQYPLTFPQLSQEIQDTIWRNLLPPPRMVLLHHTVDPLITRQFGLQRSAWVTDFLWEEADPHSLPIILHICRASRAIALQTLKYFIPGVEHEILPRAHERSPWTPPEPRPLGPGETRTNKNWLKNKIWYQPSVDLVVRNNVLRIDDLPGVGGMTSEPSEIRYLAIVAYGRWERLNTIEEVLGFPSPQSMRHIIPLLEELIVIAGISLSGLASYDAYRDFSHPLRNPSPILPLSQEAINLWERRIEADILTKMGESHKAPRVRVMTWMQFRTQNRWETSMNMKRKLDADIERVRF